ncbi:MAG TPA: DNA repair protein RecO [Acidimicrobiales bacterium]|jgi:DNA repair protein RecO (recombination protein O)|nr:DNA repair protein RecO [Acidimicrobiales bacterium]
MSLYRDEAIVIRTYRLGEADRIVVLFTKARGKVRAVAKGVRKTTSRFGARLEPTSHVALQLYEGRNLDTITQAETLDHFRPIREDLERISRASSILEGVDQISQEREPNAALYGMLLGALRALSAGDHPLIVPAFFWKLLALEGLSPVVDACVVCGAGEGLCAFAVEDGGVVCADHRRGVPLSAESIELLQLILGGRLGVALSRPVTTATIDVDHLATRALEYHLERRLRSIGVLDHG